MSNAARILRKTDRTRNLHHRRAVEGGRPELSGRAVLEAARAVDAHAGKRGAAGRPWTPTDTATMRELDARSWTTAELGQRRMVAVPAWLCDMEVTRADGSQGPLVPRGRGGGLVEFVATVVQAHRAGALGVLLSLEECAALARVSVRTWSRWRAELEQLGLVTVLATWAPCERADGRERDRRRNLYLVGPTLEAIAGPALYEGLTLPEDGPAARQWRTTAATALRRRAAQHRREVTGAAWSARANRRDPSPNCSAIVAPHPGPSRTGDTSPAPVRGGGEHHAEPRPTAAAAVLPLRAPRAPAPAAAQPPRHPAPAQAAAQPRPEPAARPADPAGGELDRGTAGAADGAGAGAGPPPGTCPELWAILVDAVDHMRRRADAEHRADPAREPDPPGGTARLSSPRAGPG
jgi:hypothetical protein